MVDVGGGFGTEGSNANTLEIELLRATMWYHFIAKGNLLLGFIVGADPGGAPGPGPPPTTKKDAPAPKFYKTEAPEWQF